MGDRDTLRERDRVREWEIQIRSEREKEKRNIASEKSTYSDQIDIGRIPLIYDMIFMIIQCIWHHKKYYRTSGYS